MKKNLLLACCFFIFQNCGNEQPDSQKIVRLPPSDSTASDKKVVRLLPDEHTELDEKKQPSAEKNEPPAPKNEPPSRSPFEATARAEDPKRAQPVPGSQNFRKKQLRNFDDVEKLDGSIRLDIKYATTDNFTKSKIYDCPKCLLRPEAAAAIVQAHRQLQKQNLGLKMFDCYRPRPYQQRLWDKVPNPDYVTPPTRGSMHSRGAAVDLTIVDAAGKELDMGTAYDFFGREAHTDYLKHSPEVLKNRELLRSTLAAVGFKGIRTEWWHFSFQGKDFPLSDEVWDCKN